MNLDRYSAEEQVVIKQYFEMISDTRLTGTISEGIKNREVKYWENFSPDVVIEALRIHLVKYPGIRESYTRGIMRNLQAQGFVKKELKRNNDRGLVYETSESREQEVREELKLFYAKKGKKLR